MIHIVKKEAFSELNLALSLNTRLVFDDRDFTLYNYKMNLEQHFERQVVDEIDASPFKMIVKKNKYLEKQVFG